VNLTTKNIQLIEKLIKPGDVVEVFIEPQHKVDAGGGEMVSLPDTLVIRARPPITGQITFTPIALNDEDWTHIEITARNPGEEPIALVSLEIPAGKSITGITTAESRKPILH
jgi:hypothetical protein